LRQFEVLGARGGRVGVWGPRVGAPAQGVGVLCGYLGRPRGLVVGPFGRGLCGVGGYCSGGAAGGVGGGRG